MKFAIFWNCGHGYKAYITKRGMSSRNPFTDNINDPDIKLWTTENRAKVWLSLKDSGFASKCEIVPVNFCTKWHWDGMPGNTCACGVDKDDHP